MPKKPNNRQTTVESREFIPGAWATLFACVLSASASASTPAAAERSPAAPAAATERGATPAAAAPKATAAAAAAPAAASAASAASAAAPAAAAALLREEALHGKQLIRRDVELVALGVARSHDALGHLDREHGRVDGAEDLFNLANLGLVLQEDWAVEVRNLGVRELAHGLALARVDELANLGDGVGRALIEAAAAASAAAAAPSAASAPSPESHHHRIHHHHHRVHVRVEAAAAAAAAPTALAHPRDVSALGGDP
mmetsp:Transcript_3674/g.16861  ORF Transcript_3674/g.16861 Transcript_3674/m.16861 type:complete len:256 (-) Transcript_3674:918-1685(-)